MIGSTFTLSALLPAQALGTFIRAGVARVSIEEIASNAGGAGRVGSAVFAVFAAGLTYIIRGKEIANRARLADSLILANITVGLAGLAFFPI